MSFCLSQKTLTSCGHQHHKYLRPKPAIIQRHILLILILGMLTYSMKTESKSVNSNSVSSNARYSQDQSIEESKSTRNNSEINVSIYWQSVIDQLLRKSPAFQKRPKQTFPNTSANSSSSMMGRISEYLLNINDLEQENYARAKSFASDHQCTSQVLLISGKLSRQEIRRYWKNIFSRTSQKSRRRKRKGVEFWKVNKTLQKRSLILPYPEPSDSHITDDGTVDFATTEPVNFSLITNIKNTTAIASTARHLQTRGNSTINSVIHKPFQSRRGEKNVIYIHGQFEMSGGDCRPHPRAGPYELKGAQLAIRHINAKHIIPGFRLQMYKNDSKCDSGVAVDSFYYSLYRQPTMMMILGTGSSEVTEKLARVVSRWNIIQVSYGATSPALSDRKNFPFFFRTVAPDSSHNTAILAFVQHFKWDTIATLHEQGDIHALPMNKLVTELEQVNISISFTKGVSERDYKDHLQELKEQDCRIFIGSFSYSLMPKIFCHVYHLKMYGAEYVWILQGDLKEAWWIHNATIDCTRTQLKKAVMGLIVVGSHYKLEANETTLSGITAHDLLRKIGFGARLKNSGFVSQAYDAVWAMALALAETQREYLNMKTNMTLNDFTYYNYDIAQQVATVLSKLRFVGVSGPLSFHNSDRLGITSFHQNQGGRELTLIGLHYPESEDINFKCEDCVQITWQGSKVPIARRIIRLKVAVLDRGVLICVTSLAVFGVILALTFLVFNLHYRKLKFIKLSSPNLNNFVLVGCVLVYVAMILLGMDHSSLTNDNHFSGVCSARAFLLSGGFSLAFGCMFIKTYRVYHIFIRSNTGIVKSKLLHDQQLLALVGVLVLVDCFVITLWVTLDPMERTLRNLTMQVNPSERNVVYLYQREQCYSIHMAKWLGTMYIYKGLLLVVGCYMAWETRHVKIPALNDSQYIGMSVYNVVITSTLVVALANVIPVERYTLTFVLVSTLIFVSTTMTLCLLFVPKIHTIMTKYDDEVAIVATPGVKIECKTRRFAIDESRESMYRAEVLNRALKRELLELEEDLARLSKRVGVIPPRRNNSELLQQDDESDDDLPPWLAEYKKYPPRSQTEDMWYSKGQGDKGSGACFSVLSAVHPLLLSTVEYPSSSDEDKYVVAAQKEKNLASTSRSRNKASAIRSSLPAITLIDCRQKLSPPSIQDQVRSCTSDRALNHLKQAPIPTLTKIANWSLSKLNCKRNSDPFKLQKSSHIKQLFSTSASRLQNDWNQSNSLPKIVSSTDGSHQSLFSGHTTSLESDWATAPQYSSSFATAKEDVSSNTNHNLSLITPTQSPQHFSLQRNSLTDSTCSNGPFVTDNSSSSGDRNENFPGCGVKCKPNITSESSNVNIANLGTTQSSAWNEGSANSHQTSKTMTPDVGNCPDGEEVLVQYESGTLSTDNDFKSLFPQCSFPTTPTINVNVAVTPPMLFEGGQDNIPEIEETDFDKGTPTSSKTLIEPSDSNEELSILEDSSSIASTADGLRHNTSPDNVSNVTISADFENTAKELLGSVPPEESNDNENMYRSLNTQHGDVTHSNLAIIDNNNSTNPNLRQQMFQLERDLILLDLEKSDAIDL